MIEERLGFQLEARKVGQSASGLDIGHNRARPIVAQVGQPVPLGKVSQHGGEPVQQVIRGGTFTRPTRSRRVRPVEFDTREAPQ